MKQSMIETTTVVQRHRIDLSTVEILQAIRRIYEIPEKGVILQWDDELDGFYVSWKVETEKILEI